MQVQTWEFLVGHRELGLLKMENDGEVYVLHYGPNLYFLEEGTLSN